MTIEELRNEISSNKYFKDELKNLLLQVEEFPQVVERGEKYNKILLQTKNGLVLTVVDKNTRASKTTLEFDTIETTIKIDSGLLLSDEEINLYKSMLNLTTFPKAELKPKPQLQQFETATLGKVYIFDYKNKKLTTEYRIDI